MKLYAIPKVCIIREKKNLFSVIYPEGMIAKLSNKELYVMLNCHRESSLNSIFRKSKHFVDLTMNDLKSIIENFRSNQIIDLLEEKEINDHFDASKVLHNIGIKKIKCINLCDLAIFFTNQCNFSCTNCSANANESNKDNLNIIIAKKMISDAISLGCTTIAISGGEPILPNNISYLVELVKFAKEGGVSKITIATNGYYLSNYIDDLKEAGVTRFSVSYHGLMNEFVNDNEAAVRSRKSWLAVIESNIHLGINSVVTPDNFNVIYNIVDEIMPAIRGVEHAYLRISPLVNVGRAKGKTALNPQQMEELIDFYLRLESIYGDQIRLTCFEDIEANAPLICDAGLCYVCIGVNGDVCPCDLLVNEFNFGNIYKESFMEIWNNDLWVKFRSFDKINKRCASCKSRLICFGKCRALAYLKYGSVSMNKEPKKCLI